MVIVLAIGKTILILLIVIACILAAVLLLPVRYEVDADIEKKRADAHISWLFRLVRFRFHAGDGMRAVLSILCFKIDFTDPEAKKRRAAKKAKKEAKKAAKARRKSEKKRRCGDSGCKIPDEDSTTVKKEDFETSGFPADGTAAGKTSVRDKFSNATGAVKDAARKAGEAKDKVSGFGKTAKRMIGLVKKYEVVGIAWPKLVRFLNRIRPRKLTGCVEFGLEDPATTGKVVGALAVVPFLYQTDLRIVPDFETDEAYIKGQVYTRGHILLIWIVMLAIGLIKEKKLRRFMSDIRHGREP